MTNKRQPFTMNYTCQLLPPNIYNCGAHIQLKDKCMLHIIEIGKWCYPNTILMSMCMCMLLSDIQCHVGIPGKPTISSVRQEEDDLTVTWTIDKDERRPVDTYIVKIQIPGSRNQDSEFNMTIDTDKANCKPSGTEYHCMFTIMERKLDDGKTYDLTVCARNVLGQNCSDPLTPIPPKPSTAPLLPTGSILGIVFGVIVAVLACCLIVILVALIICCCGCAEREKVYNPEKKGTKANSVNLKRPPCGSTNTTDGYFHQ